MDKHGNQPKNKTDVTAAHLRNANLHLKVNSDIQLAGKTVNKHKRCEYSLLVSECLQFEECEKWEM